MAPSYGAHTTRAERIKIGKPMQQHTQSGFILFSVLVFILLALSLALMMMDSSETEFNMTNNFYQQQQLSNKINGEMNNAYQEIQSGFISCQIQNTSSYELKHEPISFWNSSSVCQKDNFSYVIEVLPINQCVTIDQVHAAQFYRITGRARDQNVSSMILQAVYSLNSSNLVKCRSTIKQIAEGRQSWRMLE